MDDAKFVDVVVAGLLWLVLSVMFLDALSEKVDSVWEGVSFYLVERFPCWLDLVFYVLKYSCIA